MYIKFNENTRSNDSGYECLVFNYREVTLYRNIQFVGNKF